MRSKWLLALIGSLIALPLMAAPPYLVKNINANVSPHSSYPSYFVKMGSLAFFSTTDYYGYPQQLWRTDGTAAGTFYLAPGGYNKVVWNGKLWFLTGQYSNQSPEIWSTDGTVAGTQKMILPPLPQTFQPMSLMAGTTHLYFFVDRQLWQTDGTTAGTVKISDGPFALAFIDDQSDPQSVIIGSTVYFMANIDAAGMELWRLDNGVPSVVLDLGSTWNNWVHTVMSAGNLLYFQITTSSQVGVSGTQLWRSDGTAAGTTTVKTPAQISLNLGFHPTNVLTSGSTVYFVGTDQSGGVGMKLWQSDGTPAGTSALASTLPGSVATDFSATPLARLANGTMLFRGPTVGNDSAAFGYWAFDGTNTTFLANTVGHGNWTLQSAVAGNYAVFGFSGHLWRSDGTIGGTFTIADMSGNDGYHDWPMIDLGTDVLFGAYGMPYGFEAWKTNGAAGNVTLLADINATTYPSSPMELTAFKGGVLFTATADALSDSSYQGTRDLWFSDGTEAGTQRLRADADVFEIHRCGTRAFFEGRTDAAGRELWMTDGTPGGTVMLKDLYPGTTNGIANSSSPGGFACMDDILFFFARTAPGSEMGLWRSDGTAGGTLQIMTFDGNFGRYTIPFPFGHAMYFGIGKQLWRSDGTPGGTFMVRQLPDEMRDIERGFIASGPQFYFVTYGPGLHRALWKSDGTFAGTVMYKTAPYLTPYSDFYGRLAFTWTEQYTVEHGLCTTDGTEAGTTCFDPQTSSSGGWDFEMRPFNGRLYYNKPVLYSTDGGTTYAETGVKTVTKFLADAGGRLFVDGAVYEHAHAMLSESDGTAAGTQILMTKSVTEAVSSGGRLFIAADELYAYDLEVTPTSFAPRAVAAPGGEIVTITGRGFVGPVSITVGNSPAVVGTVTPASITFTAPVNETGAYDVKLILGDGRYITLDEQLLYTCASPVAVVSASPEPVCPLMPVQLEGSGGTQCSWFPTTGLDDPSSCTPMAMASETTTYTLIVSDNGCESTNHPSVTVTVHPWPDATITVNGASPMQPNTTYSAFVPDAGPGATYSWSATNATILSDPTGRTITFRTSCNQTMKLTATVSSSAGCSATTTKTVFVTGFGGSSFSPRLAHPGSTITITGVHLECFSSVRLMNPSSTVLWREVSATVVDNNTLQFRYPVDAIFRLEVALRPGDLPIGYPVTSSLIRAAHRDLSGNGSADVFWRNSATGETQIWSMFATSVFRVFSWTAPTSWVPYVMGDFDGDGASDILWRNTSTGQTSIWFMWNGTVKSAAAMLSVHPDWKPAGTGDFDFDGKYDVFWINTVTGETSVWFMNGSNFNGVRSWTVPPSWQPVAFGDFNNDGKTDVFWRSPSTGETSIWLMNGAFPSTAVRSDTVDPNWVVAGTGRFDVGPTMDIFWRNTVTGQNSMWFMNGTSYTGTLTQSVPLGWWPVSFGEFNGNGSTHDIFWHNASTGETSIWLMNSLNTGGPSTAVRSTTLDPNWRVLTSP